MYFNRTAKDKPQLQADQHARIQPFANTREWRQGTVEMQLSPRSYEVETTNGQTYRRNRIHLRPTKETLPTPHTTHEKKTTIAKKTTTNKETSTQSSNTANTRGDKKTTPKINHETSTTTRSGRPVIQPRYLEDCSSISSSSSSSSILLSKSIHRSCPYYKSHYNGTQHNTISIHSIKQTHLSQRHNLLSEASLTVD